MTEELNKPSSLSSQMVCGVLKTRKQKWVNLVVPRLCS